MLGLLWSRTTVFTTPPYFPGFLNSYPGSESAGVASNFALLDQIAALSWLTDNIRHFNGNNRQVTLVGRDTGAACITYLMESPVLPATGKHVLSNLYIRIFVLLSNKLCSTSLHSITFISNF